MFGSVLTISLKISTLDICVFRDYQEKDGLTRWVSRTLANKVYLWKTMTQKTIRRDMAENHFRARTSEYIGHILWSSPKKKSKIWTATHLKKPGSERFGFPNLWECVAHVFFLTVPMEFW